VTGAQGETADALVADADMDMYLRKRHNREGPTAESR
jgi:hypothetical protein